MKKTFLLMIILFLCGFSFAQNTDRYINLSIDTYEGAIYGDEDYGCKLWFDMGNQQDWLYIVKYDEMSNYDIAFITSHEADYFSQWAPPDSLYYQEVQVGIYNEDTQMVEPIPYSLYSDDDLGNAWCKGNLRGFYFPFQTWYVDGYSEVYSSLTTIEPYGMGDPPWFSYEYFDYTLTAEGEGDWNWVSFPVLDPDYVDPLDHVLAPVIDDLVEVQHYQDYIFKDYSGVWQNEIGDFSSTDGYKIQMENERTLTVAGYWEDPNTPIPLEAEEPNWIGYFLTDSHSVQDAFAGIWDNIVSIIAEDWFYFAPVPDPDTCHIIRGSVNPGELYIVNVNQDTNLVWNDSNPPVSPYTKEETDYFTYQEKAEYMPITIDTVMGTVPEEIAAYVDGECVGASKVVDGFPVQILAYTPDEGSKDGTIYFMIYSGQKGGKLATNYTVYNRKVNAYIDETVHYNKDNFVTIRLDTEATSEQQAEFKLLRNYPNPVKNGITHISFASAIEAENTELIIYNIKGQLITILNCNNADVGKNGLKTVTWDCTDSSGRKVENGVYFYKLVSNNKQAVRKMIIVE